MYACGYTRQNRYRSWGEWDGQIVALVEKTLRRFHSNSYQIDVLEARRFVSYCSVIVYIRNAVLNQFIHMDRDCRFVLARVSQITRIAFPLCSSYEPRDLSSLPPSLPPSLCISMLHPFRFQSFCQPPTHPSHPLLNYPTSDERASLFRDTCA